MENASKALIIAGAILLAIAIIGIGMYVYNNASEAISGTDMTEQEVNTYNEPFLRYQGEIKGSRAKTLCSSVASHNRTAEDASELIVLVNGEVDASVPAPTEEDAAGTSTADITEISNAILSGRTYNVTIGFDPNTGMVSTIGIALVE